MDTALWIVHSLLAGIFLATGLINRASRWRRDDGLGR
jgi:hypothetical protein